MFTDNFNVDQQSLKVTCICFISTSIFQYKFTAYAETPHANLPLQQIVTAKKECWAAEVKCRRFKFCSLMIEGFYSYHIGLFLGYLLIIWHSVVFRGFLSIAQVENDEDRKRQKEIWFKFDSINQVVPFSFIVL